jgi:short subunit dehydrogenase-like uncharacterized protein
MNTSFLLYGATGYTAQLMLPLMAQYGLRPILAGRNAEKIMALAKSYNLDYQIFDLSETAKLDKALQGVSAVLHCAGPFSHTAKPMIEACLRTGRHYLDITGEYEVYEWAASLHEQARERGVLLLPGVGFDVVPTDCMALHLKQLLPDATHLRLAFASVGGGVSHGTAKTSAESLGKSGVVRQQGKLIPVPLAYKSLEVDFGGVRRFTMTIPWGDLSTAWHNTGIPNIEVYMSVHPKSFQKMQWQRHFAWFFRLGMVQKFLWRKIESLPAGPDEARRAKAKMYVWGDVRNAQGDVRSAQLQLSEGYTFTAHAALHIMKKVLEGNVKPGFYTPSGLFGSDLVAQIESGGTIIS